MNDTLNEDFEVLDSYNATIMVEKYCDTDTSKEDIIKTVTIKVEYDFMNKKEEFIIKKLKIKE